MKKIKIKNVLALGLGALALTGSTMALTSCSFSDLKDKIVDIFDGDKDKPVQSSDTTPIVDGVETQEGDLSNIAFPKSIIHRSNATNNVMNLSVNVEPSYAVNQTLSWSLAWASSNSGNVSDYVTLAVSSNTHSATLTCKQAYTTQIILKVATTDGSNIQQTCTLDYLCREFNVNGNVVCTGDLSNTDISTIIAKGITQGSFAGGSISSGLIYIPEKYGDYDVIDIEFTYPDTNIFKDVYTPADLNFIVIDGGLQYIVYGRIEYNGVTIATNVECIVNFVGDFNFNSQLKVTNISINTSDVKF